MTAEHPPVPPDDPHAGSPDPGRPPEGTRPHRVGVGARLWSLRAVVAAAVTAVALGGVGGAALAKASDGGSERGGPGHGFGGPPGMTGHTRGQQPGQMNGRMNGQMNGQPPGQPGQQPPAGG